jgi:5-methylcytosine-specific restriction endonuclease McrA
MASTPAPRRGGSKAGGNARIKYACIASVPTMTNRPGEFSRATQQHALARQEYKCASCGTPISALGQVGRSIHRFGEGARAHHIRHVKFGGTDLVDNCVVLCESCHYSAHEGGNYRRGTVVGVKQDFPHFNG